MSSETFSRQLTDLGRDLDRLTGAEGMRLFTAAMTDAAKVGGTAVKRAGISDGSLLTRRIVTSGGVNVTAARAANGLIYASVSVGGRGGVNASGRPLVGQVIYGAEFGGQRRRTVTLGNGQKHRLKAGRRQRTTVAEQAALHRAAGNRVTASTAQFRPWRRGGYWLFSSLAAATPAILEAAELALGGAVEKVNRG